MTFIIGINREKDNWRSGGEEGKFEAEEGWIVEEGSWEGDKLGVEEEPKAMSSEGGDGNRPLGDISNELGGKNRLEFRFKL